MSQFTNSFWDFYIGVVTVVSIIACAVFLKMQSVRKLAPGEAVETTGHTWDETLGEYHHPLPRWWVWMFYVTIWFSLGYLVLYPGLGSWGGTLGWTQVKQLEEENVEAAKLFGPIYDKYAKLDLKEVAASAEARAIGQKLFLNNCAQCHASDAGGSKGFPNLTDRDWLWGGDPQDIKNSIAVGRTGVMPPFGPALGEKGVRDAAHYVLSLSGLAHDSLRAASGKATFAQSCAVCHGPEGKGNPQLGAPNLTDKVWLHGGGEPTIIETITKGRNNQMPAHMDSLGEAKVHLLAAYVWSLSNPPVGAAPPGK
jgi:cytochrome c oxidase cbb3-type subunit 3